MPGLAGMGQKTGVQRTQRARKRRESFKRGQGYLQYWAASKFHPKLCVVLGEAVS